MIRLAGFAFSAIDWSRIEATVHPGIQGFARWRTRQFGEARVRVVEYSPGYLADHWCRKGHVVLCLAGELQTDLADGRSFTLSPGMSYQAPDDDEPHRSRSDQGATLFIVD